MRFLIALAITAAMCFPMASGSIRTKRMIENPTVRLIGYAKAELETHAITGPLSPEELAVPIAHEAGVPLFEYLDDPALTAFSIRFETDFPVSVSVRHDGEASGIPVTVTDPATIRAVFEALRQITVRGERPGSGHTDDYLHYYFEMADGRVLYGFAFQDAMLLDEWMGLYEITGFDALQKALPDPGL